MKRIWHIAFNDIKLMVRDKIFFFWTLVFPLIFILIFGNLYKPGSGSDLQASLNIINKDKGQWGAYFIDQIKSPGIQLALLEEEPEKYTRIMVIPEDFSAKIEARESQELILKKHKNANAEAAQQAQTRIIQAIAKVITELILHPDTSTFFDSEHKFKDMLVIKSQFPEDTIRVIPSGFDHVIPGIIVQFIMMMVLIYGGISVMTDRKKGVMSRILFSSANIPELWGGKFLGRLMMGLLQAMILVVMGILFFSLNLGNYFLSFLNILIFSIAMAAVSIFFGSVMQKEDLIVGVSILTANIFSGLGGCWWPIEIVPETVRTIGMISPAYWAMDAFHQVIFFNKGFSHLLPNFAVMLGYTVIFTFLAVKYFKIKE